MSYAIVEAEIDNLTRNLLEIQPKIEADESLQALVYTFDNFLHAVQEGTERHVEECMGVIRAVHVAREKIRILET